MTTLSEPAALSFMSLPPVLRIARTFEKHQAKGYWFLSGSGVPVRLWSTDSMTISPNLRSYLLSSASQLEALVRQPDLSDIISASVEEIVAALVAGHPLLTCGNGGSASDALHVSGELVGRFFHDRQALNVICLNSNVTVMTAWANDIDFNSVFSRQVEAHGKEGGVLWGFSTSGNSKNVVNAFKKANIMGMKTIAMTGVNPGVLGELANYIISVPGDDAPSAQNLHVLLYHYMCAEIERMTNDISG